MGDHAGISGVLLHMVRVLELLKPSCKPSIFQTRQLLIKSIGDIYQLYKYLDVFVVPFFNSTSEISTSCAALHPEDGNTGYQLLQTHETSVPTK